MNPQILFLIIIVVIVLDFLIDKWIDHLNALHFEDEVPEPLKDVYDEKEYRRSQAYKKDNYRFSLITSTLGPQIAAFGAVNGCLSPTGLLK